MSKTLLILGAGGHGRSVAEAALLGGDWTEVVFLDDSWPAQKEVLGCRIIGPTTEIPAVAPQCQGAVAAVGNNKLRERWTHQIEAAGIELVSVIHPRAWVSPSARIGAGSVILAGGVVGTIAVLGKGVIINANATADHDVQMGDFAHLGVGSQLAGGVKVGARAWLQAGSSCGYHVEVGEGALFGPGTVLSATA